MGTTVVDTPAIDQLIENGVRFRNTYIAEPTSSPSRVALLTGVHERVNGVGFSSSYDLTEQQWEQTYPALLKNAGYYTGFIGKLGIEYYTFMDKIVDKFDSWYAHNGWARFFPKDIGLYEDAKEDVVTRIMADGAVDFIKGAPKQQPFCLSVSFSSPHGSITTSMGNFNTPANENPRMKDDEIYGDLYRDQNIEIPADTECDPYQFIPKALLDQTQGRDKIYYSNYKKNTNLEHHIRYYQLITGIDRAVAEIVQTLKEQGLDKNTIIIFGSDHGLLLGEYGMGGKALLYDLASKIPCFVYDPRLKENKRGRNVDELVSSLDITSTILDYAEVEQPSHMQGESLVPLIKGERPKWRKYLFLENLYTGRDTPIQEGIRLGEWKYIRMYDGIEPYAESDVNFTNREPDFEQLFNIKSDPQEKKNLISDPKHKAILAKLRSMCQDGSEQLNQSRESYKERFSIANRAPL